jgi:hypothetical protein
MASSNMLHAHRSRRMRPHEAAAPARWLLLTLLLAAGMPGVRAQLSKGIVGDHSVETTGNKFLQRNAHEDTAAPAPK